MPITLDADQRRAAQMFDTPCLVIAPPGTGKTETLTEKFFVASEDRGIDPSRILSVSFTRKAARELRRRITDRLQSPMVSEDSLWIGTFHGLAARILRAHGDETGLGADFTVPEADEVRRLVAAAIRRTTGSEATTQEITSLCRQIDATKNAGGRIDRPLADWPLGLSRPDERSLRIMESYQDDLRQSHMADYGDLMCLCLDLFANHPAIAKDWRERFDLVMVDEFQDINLSQEAWLDALIGEGTTFTAVGDDDQSVYGWRGADVGRILAFAERYRGAEIVTLTNNYRNPQDLIDRASLMLERNKTRRRKASTARASKNGRIRVRSYRSPPAMLDLIRGIIDERDPQYKLNDVCIMLRRHKELQTVASSLVLAGVPAYIMTSEKLVSNPMQILMSWLRLIVNPYDTSALMNLAERHSTPAIAEAIRQQSRMRGQPVIRTIQDAVAAGRLKDTRLAAVAGAVVSLGAEAETTASSIIVDRVYEQTGVEALIQSLPAAEQARFFAMYTALTTECTSKPALRDVVAAAQDSMAAIEEFPEAVILSTMHGMKGLQCPIVISPHWDENEFPRRGATAAEIEDERRLASVTIGRASAEAWLLYDERAKPSRFLKELGLA